MPPRLAGRPLAGTRRLAIDGQDWHHRPCSSISCQEARVLKKVVLIALPGVAPFEFGVICEVFGIDRSDSGGPAFDFTIATAEPGPVRTSLGYDMVIDQDLSIASDADLIAVPAHHIRGIGDEATDERVLRAVRDAQARGAWVLSVCSGAFVLAEAGILDGRKATTRWTPTCCSSRTTRSSPAPAPRPASTRPCTSCAQNSARRRPT
jgi:hypothetical protein